ncbi:MAG: hemerythrin domain-containing protein [Rhodocyclaceae bacterium]|nr:hemerythrin domain-containing protein [Rhodocyclaceae bacterium]
MAELQMRADLEVGVARMDAVHAEFVNCYNALAQAPESGFVAALDDFIAHCESHFAMENEWMATTAFPGCHRAEHDRVLQVMRDIRARAQRGDFALGRQLVREIPEWFETHATGMDAALAYFLNSIGFDAQTGRPPEGWKPAGEDADAGEKPRCT